MFTLIAKKIYFIFSALKSIGTIIHQIIDSLPQIALCRYIIMIVYLVRTLVNHTIIQNFRQSPFIHRFLPS